MVTTQDKMIDFNFGLSALEIKALREYEEKHGKFHPECDLRSCIKKAMEEFAESIQNDTQLK